MPLSFEWDGDKALSNRNKHGISFEAAVRASPDPNALFEQDRIVHGEGRCQTIGMSMAGFFY